MVILDKYRDNISYGILVKLFRELSDIELIGLDANNFHVNFNGDFSILFDYGGGRNLYLRYSSGECFYIGCNFGGYFYIEGIELWGYLLLRNLRLVMSYGKG